MGAGGQIEIVNPDGEVSFKTLDPEKGVANIGRHPDNDITLDGTGVAPFHAVLDYSRSPHHLIVLSTTDGTLVGGQHVDPATPIAVHAGSTIQVAGFVLFILGEPGDASMPSTPGTGAAAQAGVLPLALAAPTDGVRSLVETNAADAQDRELLAASSRRVLPYAEESDDLVLAEASETEWMIDVEESAVCHLTITNGGGIVAAFRVRVEGIDADWVITAPPYVNLTEGERATVTVSVTPPRRPESRAGVYPIALIVESPNYPSHRRLIPASLTVNPYHEFAVGELSPRQQTLRGRRPTGEAVFSIANKGNSEVPVRLEGYDDERACNFEFRLPGESAPMARQAEIRLPPSQTFAIPTRITPLAPKLVGLRSRTYSYTITATMLEGQLTPRSLLGQVRVRPLIGPILLLLTALLLALLVVVVFRPRIYEFEAEPDVILSGETVVLAWRASRFSSLSILTDSGDVVPPIASGSTQVELSPERNETYYLVADNLLSQFLPPLSRLTDTRKEAQVIVDPVYPVIRVFTSDATTIVAGEQVNLRWEVLGADEVVLSANGNEEKLLTTEHTSERAVAPIQSPSNYTLRATNQYGYDANSIQITVLMPTPTPLPLPVIRQFSVEPLSVTEGQTVTLRWEVDGATKVAISNLNQEYAPSGNTLTVPPATTDYVLTALFEADGRQVSTVSFPVTVVVHPKPTATPEPLKPEISYFRADPAEVVKGNSTQVKLVWLVTGETTNVEISGPTLGSTFSNLSAQGELIVSATDATFFILSAFNGDLTASETVQLGAKDPTPVPPTPLPKPVVDYFVLDESAPDVLRIGSEPNNQLVRYEVVGGTTATFQWSVQMAPSIEIIADGVSLGEYPPQQSTPRLINSAGQYQLIAQNDVGDTVNAYIQITLRPVVPPLPPFNVGGEQAAHDQPATVTWQFDPGSYSGEVVGFRIYRAEVPYADIADFALVANESEVKGTPPYRWTDPVTACNQAYCLRAVYQDEYGVNQVTGPSEVWHTFPCP